MNRDIFEGKWKQMKGSVKRFFGELTDDDLTAAEGGYDRFVGVVQERYGWSRERAEDEVDRFFSSSEYPR
ncbi:MAG: CsbD family protein [Chloroflexota bacterium]